MGENKHNILPIVFIHVLRLYSQLQCMRHGSMHIVAEPPSTNYNVRGKKNLSFLCFKGVEICKLNLRVFSLKFCDSVCKSHFSEQV